MLTTTTDHHPYSPLLDVSNNPSLLIDPSLDLGERVWIAMVILIPVVVILLLCSIIVCMYRHKKFRTQQSRSTTSIDQHHIPISTIFNNSQHNQLVTEALPPSYDLLFKTKKEDASSV